jgi:DNA primase
LITEGQIDTLSAIEAGFKNTVSIPGGTENLKFT